MVGNLVSNAIKYTPGGGTVGIEVGTEDDWIWVRVSDTGPGIPLEMQEKMFQPFDTETGTIVVMCCVLSLP